jgi:SOS-response transcriptional repressor LexA
MNKISRSQQQLLEILRDRTSAYTLEELAGMLGLANKSSVHYNIKQLMQKGFLKTNPSNSSDYIVMDNRDDGVMYLPLYSGAKCGPNGKFVTEHDTSEIPIPSRLFPFDTAQYALAIRTEGSSMEPKIPENAVVIINKQESEYVPNQPFLAIVNDMPLIKVVYDPGKDSPNYILTSYNPDFPPFLVEKKNTVLVGRVRGLIKSF